MMQHKFNSVAMVLLVALTSTGAGVMAHTTFAVTANMAPESEAKDEKLADTPEPSGKDQAKPAANSPIPLQEAVEELNRKTPKNYFELERARQPPLPKEKRPKALTVEEVVLAIKHWDRKPVPARWR